MWNKIKAFASETWSKIKAACFNSITMAWSYVLTALGTVFAYVDAMAAVLGDPGLTQQISAVVGDAKTLGKWLLTVGIITAIARLKSLIAAKKE